MRLMPSRNAQRRKENASAAVNLVAQSRKSRHRRLTLRREVPANTASCAVSGMDDAETAAEAFARTMTEAVGPLECRPHVAVALSGGADSMALCSLASVWALGRGGRVTALTVDHRLRPESTTECQQVARWMRRAGIEHHILPWLGAKPASGIQQAARNERYRLLTSWCRAASVSHLLLGHHRSDQAETVLFRLLRGSGLSGLAAMSPVAEASDVRLLRPLLDWSPDLLRALLRRWGWDWLDDPSNVDRRFARAQLRHAAPSLAASGVTTEALLGLAADATAARTAMRDAVAELLAAACRLHPAGFARLDRPALAAAASEVAAAALARLLAAVGGGAYPPPLTRVRAILAAFAGGEAQSRTLARCRIVSHDGELWLFRECRDLPAERALRACEDQPWDGRFRLIYRESRAVMRAQLRIRPFAPADARILRSAGHSSTFAVMPHLARGSLPILSDEKGLAMVPLMDYCRPDIAKLRGMIVQMAWKPRHDVTGPGCFEKCDN